MLDQIADFPLRTASAEQLGITLGRCFAEYNAWHAKACFIGGFAEEARVAGVESVVTGRIQRSVGLARELGILTFSTPETNFLDNYLDSMVSKQLVEADTGVKVAAMVMLHNALERFLWRLVRFGLAANRSQAIAWIAGSRVSVEELANQDKEVVIDNEIEKWWRGLERESLVKKWDKLIGLVGFPEHLNDAGWRFDREMLIHFDEVRNNAVHHDGRDVKNYDLDSFTPQLWRVQLVWVLHLAQNMDLKVPGEVMFSTGAE
jgi:hypothetical protein